MTSGRDAGADEELAALRREVDRLSRALGRARRALKKARVALRSADVLDPLTGLPLRSRALAWLREAGGCLLADLDGFKRINDEHGHLAGDLVLGESAAALAVALPPGAKLARFGGDEFLIACPSADLDGLLASAEAIRAAFKGALADRGLSITLGAAIARPGEAPSSILERADAALLRAKRLGGDRVEADPV